MLVIIDSKLSLGAKLPEFTQDEIKKEPMLHRASKKFALENASVITKCFISSLDWDNILIDSRVHMLMPEFYPCIPGWHHDDVPREREDGQPNYINPSYQSEHCMALFGDASITEFGIGQCNINIPPLGEKIYKSLDKEIEKLCNENILIRFNCPEKQLVYFNYHTWHRGMAATKRGFRFFIRATRNSNLKAKNEIRFNANVYMKDLSEGW